MTEIMARPLLRRIPALALSLLLAASASACVMSPRTAHSLAGVATAALWTAAIVGEVALLTYHDAHYHFDGCGHYRRYHGGHWVYYYGGHWEYYDDGASAWYYYDE